MPTSNTPNPRRWPAIDPVYGMVRFYAIGADGKPVDDGNKYGLFWDDTEDVIQVSDVPTYQAACDARLKALADPANYAPSPGRGSYPASACVEADNNYLYITATSGKPHSTDIHWSVLAGSGEEINAVVNAGAITSAGFDVSTYAGPLKGPVEAVLAGEAIPPAPTPTK